MILAHLATQLFEHRAITTTQTKAKRVRPLAERMITFAKRGDLHARRRVLRVIQDKSVVHELFTEIAPVMAERHGGYTRITKIEPRKGDNAPMAVIELVLEPVSAKQAVVNDAQRTVRRAAQKAAAVPADETAEASDEITDAPADDAADAPAGDAADAQAEETADAPVDEAADAPAGEADDEADDKA